MRRSAHSVALPNGTLSPCATFAALSRLQLTQHPTLGWIARSAASPAKRVGCETRCTIIGRGCYYRCSLVVGVIVASAVSG